MNKKRAQTIGWNCVPLLGWAIALQLWFAGPHLPHIGLYESLCFLLIVYGGQVIVTDINRIIQYVRLRKNGTASAGDTIVATRCIATTLLLLLEIATTLWDTQRHEHFSLLARVAVLTISLPIFSYTSRALLLKQNERAITRKLRVDPRQGVYS